jgi:hypothetical protein
MCSTVKSGRVSPIQEWCGRDVTKEEKYALKCAKQRQDRLENPQKYHERYLRENREKKLSQSRAWYARNIECQRARISKWAKNNRVRKRFLFKKRTTTKTLATPRWLNAVHVAQIQEMYEIAEARNVQTGVKHDVDHVIPLHGKGFNGLHVPWNLQVLTAEQNRAKKNCIPAEYTHLFWKAA